MKRMHGGVGLRLLLGLVLFAVIAAAGIAWHGYSSFVHAPLAIHRQGQTLVVPRGTSFQKIVAMLHARKLTAAPDLFWRALAMRMRVVDSLDAGEYALTPGMTPPQLLQHLAAGKVLQHDFTLVDGWTFKEVRAALAATPDLIHDSAGLSAAQIMQRVGAKGKKPEGWFLPETYAYVKGDTDMDVLRRAYDAMQKVLDKQWQQRDKNVPLTSPYQALILASIVEKETARAEERPRIAGVFVRRLKLGMPLQTDPTIIYGLGDNYHGDITWKDLRTDTPYNTYLHKGLPPTPIAMPGKPAIHAALHPAKGDALYFVARGDGSGRHVFSDTLAEHNRAVRCYQLKRC
ncbi:MAG TPA: endolytic transglycosylase MltG [Oleiagrimonas sp.]|nr:endolytic transglycosylase MltG [Oleiagrimonas sp.]